MLFLGGFDCGTIYVIRHCEAQGQSSDAHLTEKGCHQAEVLADFFADKEIKRIIASPFLRAIQTLEQLSAREKYRY
ncbi:phosphoglycerate mutase family protein [Lysinibacillus pakistanensis]|uniref:phosphoglycerate mutase family protein n=1 Tax=Lysinibacillus pakistanensis TaxID=759811 RepID=UPI003D2CEB15